GAVTPFAAMNDAERRVSVVLDAALMRHETVNCHPLVNTMTTSIARGSGAIPRSHRPSAPDHASRGAGGAGAGLSYRLQTPPLTPFNWPYSGFRRGGARLEPRAAMPHRMGPNGPIERPKPAGGGGTGGGRAK